MSLCKDCCYLMTNKKCDVSTREDIDTGKVTECNYYERLRYVYKKIYHNPFYNIEIWDNKEGRGYLGRIEYNGKATSRNLDDSTDYETIEMINKVVPEHVRLNWRDY